MQLLAGRRGGGKTTHLISLLVEHTDAYVVVASFQRKVGLLTRAGLLGLNIDPRRVVHTSELHRLQGLTTPLLYVDDLEQVLPALIGYPVTLVTTSLTASRIVKKRHAKTPLSNTQHDRLNEGSRKVSEDETNLEDGNL